MFHCRDTLFHFAIKPNDDCTTSELTTVFERKMTISDQNLFVLKDIRTCEIWIIWKKITNTDQISPR